MNRITFCAMLSSMALATACSADAPSEKTGTVQGALTQKIAQDNARVVAIGSDGRQFWSYLDQRGEFTLRVAVGQAYRLVFANQLETGGQKKVAHFSQDSANGESEWLGVYDATTINLGKLVVGSSTSANTQLSCATCPGGASAGSEDEDEDDDSDEASHSDDPPCHEDSDKSESDDDGEDGDDDDKCDVCSGAGSEASTKVKPTKDPGKDCEEKEDEAEKRKSSKPSTDGKACPNRKNGGSGGSKDATEGGGSSGGGSAGSETTAGSAAGGAGGGSATTGPEGSACKVTANCNSSCTCVAARCSAY